MDKWKNKVAVVTGASAGIGEAIARALVLSGMKVVGLARRKEKIDELANKLKGQPGKLYAFKADVTKEEEILDAFKWTTENIGPVSVLVNNAAVVQNTNMFDGDTEKWKKILDTNVLGVAIASREAVRIMRRNDIDGYIININSIAGHEVFDFPGLNIYPASKFALKAMTETLRLELARLKSNIRVSSVSPGFVKTEILVINNLITSETYEHVIKKNTGLESQDIADAVLYLLSTPLRVQVTELTIRPIWESGAISTE